jgi:hypothetical protein
MTPTMREALVAFREKHGGEMATAASILTVRVGPVVLPFPNPGYLHLHDMHHVLLDVAPTFWGEVEVSVFELRTGCPTWYVWFLCFAGCALAFLASPRRVLRACRRFRGHRRWNLYGEGARYEELMATPVAELATILDFPYPPVPAASG